MDHAKLASALQLSTAPRNALHTKVRAIQRANFINDVSDNCRKRCTGVQGSQHIVRRAIAVANGCVYQV
jgi:hypothetical protein